MKTFCRSIGLPEEVLQAVDAIHCDPAFHPDTHLLRREQTWDQGLEQLQKELDPDPRGFKLLCCQLRCALEAWEDYRRMGISREIYLATMGAFSRFLREHLESYGTYAFDRAFWTVRQISCTLFRIGTLEYELTRRDGVPEISVHIPGDAVLERTEMRRSYLDARAFLRQYFPEYAQARFWCRSWLLSPELSQLLPEHSRILDFQRSFCAQPASTPSTGVRLWVFKNPSLPLDHVPQNTSLQRSLKAFLLAGGEFYDGMGYLSEDPFQSR